MQELATYAENLYLLDMDILNDTKVIGESSVWNVQAVGLLQIKTHAFNVLENWQKWICEVMNNVTTG